MEHVSKTLQTLLDELRSEKDSEVSMLAEVLPQYVTDHNDKQAYRDIDKQVNALARSWDRMISLIEKTAGKAETIENSVESFYGD
jgi:endonuclease IV